MVDLLEEIQCQFKTKKTLNRRLTSEQLGYSSNTSKHPCSVLMRIVVLHFDRKS